jgi:small nuclear ribonucleoprotein D2
MDATTSSAPYVISDKPKSEMTADELDKLEAEEMTRGPFRLLTSALHRHSKVLVSLRNNHRLVGKVKAFDRHCNMVMEDTNELCAEKGRRGKGVKKARGNNRERYLSKLFVRGDSVVVVVFAAPTAKE